MAKVPCEITLTIEPGLYTWDEVYRMYVLLRDIVHKVQSSPIDFDKERTYIVRGVREEPPNAPSDG